MNRIVDHRGFYTSMVSVVYVMVLTGIVSPHISIEALGEAGLFWVSLLTLGFMTARSIASLLHASLYIRYSARFVGSIGLALLFTSYYLYSIVSPIYYPLIQLLTGFASGLFWPMMQSLLAISVSREWRSRGFSIYFMAGAIAGYFGYQAGSLIYSFLGPDYIYIVSYVLGIIYLLIYIVVSPGYRIVFEKKDSHGLELFKKGFSRLGYIVPLTIYVGGVNGLLKDYLIAYVKSITGYDEPHVRFLWSIAGYSGLVIGYIASYLQERRGYGREVVLLGTLLLSTVFFIPFTSDPLLLITIIASIMVGARILRPVIRGIASNKAGEPEIGVAIVNSLSNISAGLTPFIVGLTTLF